MVSVYDENTIKEFVEENRDHLEEIEPDLLAMERTEGQIDPDTINRIFRAIHSIKGSSGFFSFSAIKELSHVMENLLMLIRDGSLDPGRQGVDALLAGVDKLRIMFADVNNSDRIPYLAEIDRLNAIMREKPSPPLSHGPPGAVEKPAVESSGISIVRKDGSLVIHPPSGSGIPGTLVREDAEQAARESISSGNYIYAVWLPDGHPHPAAEELEGLMGEYGCCLFRSKSGGGSGGVAFLFATVMETDLLCEALGIEEENTLVLKSDVFLAQNDASNRIGSPSSTSPEPPLAPSIEPYSPSPAVNQSGESLSPYETVRVPVDVIDSLMNLAGELVLGRNQLRQALGQTVAGNPDIDAVLQSVDLVTSDVQEKIIQMRMQPVAKLFNKLTRLVRDASKQLNKDVELTLEGSEVELDKSILELLSDPVIHILRNAIDHGVEKPEERQSAGKPPKGTIHFKAFHQEGQVNISVWDDGRGIDPEKVARKAVAMGILSQEAADGLNPKEKTALILLPGVSTVKNVTDISGRGVGMDVVKTNIEKLGGHIDIDSEKGKWTHVKIRLPLTLAIIPSLIVGAEGHRFAVPQANIKELVCVKAGEVASRIEEVAGAEVLRLRDTLLPVVRLADTLGLKRFFAQPGTGVKAPDRRKKLLDRRKRTTSKSTEKPGNTHDRREDRDRRQSHQSDLFVVVLKLGENRFGLCVDKLFDTEEIVVKALSPHLKDAGCFAGATIMGDGKVAMILDAAGIADHNNLRFTEIGAEDLRRRKEEEKAGKDKSAGVRSVLLFSISPEEYFALPLETISRIEKADSSMIRRIGSREFMDYRGEGLPLIRLDHHLQVSPIPEEAEDLFVIIPKTTGPAAGLLASRIIDAAETSTPVRAGGEMKQGVAGTFFQEGRLVFMLDAGNLPGL